jgi:hypothetical protein
MIFSPIKQEAKTKAVYKVLSNQDYFLKIISIENEINSIKARIINLDGEIQVLERYRNELLNGQR